jgi:hypothetical protein
MRILNLILYSSNGGYYDEMRDILRTHVKNYSNVSAYFYMYDPTLQTDFDLDGDMLRIRGEETYVPGILQKTLDAMEFFVDYSFDVCIRSNISTLIDFPALEMELARYPDLQYGGPVSQIAWIDPRGGIHDGRYYGFRFVVGFAIILSPAAYRLIINNKHVVNTSIIDDVAIAEFFRDQGIPQIDLGYGVRENGGQKEEGKFFYRNCNYYNRFLDVCHLRSLALASNGGHPIGLAEDIADVHETETRLVSETG